MDIGIVILKIWIQNIKIYNLVNLVIFINFHWNMLEFAKLIKYILKSLKYKLRKKL